VPGVDEAVADDFPVVSQQKERRLSYDDSEHLVAGFLETGIGRPFESSKAVGCDLAEIRTKVKGSCKDAE
jgi:hypothetical protein